MIKLSHFFSLVCFVSILFTSSAGAETRIAIKSPTPFKTSAVEDTLCGKRIADPYRAMENLRDPLVQQWMKAESDRAQSVLQSIPGRKALIEKMQSFDKRKTAKVYDLSITDNNRYFYLKRTPKDETGKLFFRDGFKGSETPLFDPLSFSSDKKTHYVISKISPCDDGSKVAFSLAANGSENEILLIMEVATRKIYPERIDRCWFASPSWLPDASGFLYNRLQSSALHDVNREKNSKVYFHSPGTDPATDREIFSRATSPELNIKPEEIPGLRYDKDSHYLYAFASSVDNRINAWYAPVSELFSGKIRWTRLFAPADEVYDFAATENDLYCYTPKNAPRFRLLKTPIRRPDLSHAEVIIAEDPEATLTGFGLTNEAIYYTLSKNGVQEELYRKGYDTPKAERLKLPFAAGTIGLSTKGFKYPDVWSSVAGWSNDSKRFRYEQKSGIFQDETLSSPARFPEYDGLVVEEIMVPSHDGVRVPLSLIYRKGTVRNGKTPVLFYGYGAYGKSMTPFFSPSLLLWTYKGGILAVAHVRGGGEGGESWHKAGMKTSKPNTWKDLIACAEFVIREGYSSPKHIAINSASAGGILVGRAMTERPDLFAAAIPQVGAMNTVRGELTPNGPVNIPEFGTVKKPDECRALVEMDAYLHIVKGVAYPATLVTAGMNDPRVIAWQPAKFAARLEASTSSDKPVLFFTDYNAGHGVGDSKTRQFESLADVLSFGLWQTGHPEFQVK